MQDSFARATHSAGRLSAARDDRVSCIQIIIFDFALSIQLISAPRVCFSIRNFFNFFLNKETDIVVISGIFNICPATFHFTLVRCSKESLG